nr:hypothetical protein [uncultured bacterium]
MNFIIDHFIIDKVNIDKVNFARSEKGTLFTVLVTVTLDAAGLGLVMPILPTLLEQAGAAFQVIPLYVGY